MNRSNFIKKLTGGIAVSAFLPAFTFCESDSRAALSNGNYKVNHGFNTDVDVQLTAAQKNLQVLPGNKALLMPGMKVKIALKFEDFTGIFVYHCHNLEHKDVRMMRNYEVI